MKLLVSSKYLAQKLAELDYETVLRLDLNEKELTFVTANKSISMNVEVLRFESTVNQENRRWDWVRNDVTAINEQPIILDISEKVVNIILQS